MNASDQWRQIMLTLPDNYFFELMKNYLGKIETPFNKHNLVEELAKFLGKFNAEEHIIKNLSEKEIVVITSIEFIQRATAKSIFEFFLGEIPFIELCDILKTLEEKLIIYSNSGVIYLSPLFFDEVKRRVVNPGLLYKSESITPGGGQFIWLTEALILSFLSFLTTQSDLLKSSGTFKKRAYNQIDILYPNQFTDKEGEKKLEIVRRVIHNLKFFRIDGNNLLPSIDVWKRVAELPDNRRWLYLAASGTVESNLHLGERIETVKKIIETIPKTRSFYPENIKRLIKAINCDPSLNNSAIVSEFLDDLLTLKILISLDDGTITLNPQINLVNMNPDYGDKNTIILQPNFDITFKPWIKFSDGYLVAIFSTLKKMDTYTEFTLSKDGVINGLSLMPLQELINTLELVTGKPIPENINLTLNEWEKESQKAVHYLSSVLILDNDKEYIVKETGIIEKYIQLNPAPGIYLISPENYPIVKELLEGVDINPIDKSKLEHNDYFKLPEISNSGLVTIDWEEKTIEKEPSNRSTLLKILKILVTSKEEKEDLEKRINRGIIFTKEQIQKGISKTDFSEAKGINYQAKLRLIEVSLKSSNDRLEINYVEDLSIKKELILPQKIEKNGEFRILHGIKLPAEIPFNIDISKISLVRRIQTTLF